MDAAGVELVGAARLRRTLAAAGDDLSDLKAAHAAVAGVVVSRARVLAPRELGPLVGTIRPGATKRAAIVRAGNNGAVRYAGPVHYGWYGGGIQTGQPFLTDAAQQTEPQWLPQYLKALDRALDKIKGK